MSTPQTLLPHSTAGRLTLTKIALKNNDNHTLVYCGDRLFFSRWASYWNSLSAIVAVITAENSVNDTAAIFAVELSCFGGCTVVVTFAALPLVVVGGTSAVGTVLEGPVYAVVVTAALVVITVVVSFDCACTYDAQTAKMTASTSMATPFIFA
jgi:hypothetical protein